MYSIRVGSRRQLVIRYPSILLTSCRYICIYVYQIVYLKPYFSSFHFTENFLLRIPVIPMSVVTASSIPWKYALGGAFVACLSLAPMIWRLTRQCPVPIEEPPPITQSSPWKYLAMGSAATIILQWMFGKCCRKSCHSPSKPSNSSEWVPYAGKQWITGRDAQALKRLYNCQSRMDAIDEYYRTHTPINRGLSALYGRPGRHDDLATD